MTYKALSKSAYLEHSKSGEITYGNSNVINDRASTKEGLQVCSTENADQGYLCLLFFKLQRYELGKH
jgi:hypothetical protein